MLKFKNLGIKTEVIPGITSAIAGPILANIPLTHRGIANQVIFCSGSSYNDELNIPEYNKYRTYIYLMAMCNLEKIVFKLIDNKFPNNIPVCIIENVSTPLERIIYSKLKNLIIDVKKHKLKQPSIIVIGNVVTILKDI